MAQEICVYVNNLMEELVDPDALKTDGNPDIRILGNVLEAYKDILAENNLVDFASIQTEAYRLMKDNPEILKELQNRLQYIIYIDFVVLLSETFWNSRTSSRKECAKSFLW